MKKKIILIIFGVLFFITAITGGILWHYKGTKIKTYLIRHDIIKQNLDDRTDRIPILTFHGIVPDEDKEKYYSDNQWFMAESKFEEMMKYLADLDYKTLTPDEFYRWYKGEEEYTKRTVFITFDDGKTDNYYFVLPILKEYYLNATFFIIGSQLKETTKPYTPGKIDYIGMDAFQDIKDNYPNISLQSHSYGFHSRKDKEYRVQKMSKDQLLIDFEKQKELGFEYIAYPYGVYTDDAVSVAKEKDFHLAFTFSPYGYAYRSSEQYTIPRIKISGKADLNYLKKWLKY